MQIPEIGQITEIYSNIHSADSQEVFFKFESFTDPGSIYKVDINK